ncbi:MAG: exodeoxyribonuclease V subunit gamma [Anaerolineae bacterium]|jgi:ATP-dependent helicase/nuclease subunit B
MIRLLLAPAGHGKTARAIQAVRALPPLAPARVVVPDRVQAGAFRRRLAQSGGAVGTKVQTFYDLYADVLALAGGPSAGGLARLPSAVRHRLIAHLVDSLADAGGITYYTPLRGASGFARLLGQLFGELKRGRVLPQDLEQVLAPREDPRLTELSRLYAAYQTWLLDTRWVDAEGQGWLAALALERDPALLSDLALLAVDGFDEFNPTQLQVLRLLAGRAAATLVTLTGDLDRPDRLAHRRPARARAALCQTLDPKPVSLTTAGFEEPALAHLEAGLFEPQVDPVPAGDAIGFLEVQSRAAEARETLRWLKARVARNDISLSDVAVIARDVTPYRPFLEEVAAEFGVPLRFVTGADLRANPAIAALLTLLSLPLEPVDWSPRAVMDLLSSPYFDWSTCGLAPEGGVGDLPANAGQLLEVARAGQVVRGLDQWREAFQRLAEAEREEALEVTEDEEDAPRHPPTESEAEALAAVFEEIVVRVTPPTQATLRQRVAWLEALIGPDPAFEGPARGDDTLSLCVAARARANPSTAERDVAALQSLKDVLRGLVLAESVLNDGPETHVSASVFVTELTEAIEEASHPTPVEGEAVLVASALEARGLSFNSVALLGLAEGDFPRAEREDALLREADRAWLSEQGLPIEPRLRGDEVTLFYQAVTRARRRLLLSRPYLAEDGQPWEPSPYWSAVQRLFTDVTVRHVRPTDPVDPPASKEELRQALPGDAPSLAAQVLGARLQGRPSPWTGDLSPLQQALDERFGAHRPWSSSRLEAYAKCPLHFWAIYAMELEPRDLPEPGFDILILGSIYHLVLERLYDRVPDGDPDRLLELLPSVAQAVYDAAPQQYGFRPTSLWERQQAELTETLARTLEGLIDIAGDYVPVAPELAFGLRGRPPLVLPGEPVVQLRGFIDRVDRAPDGRMRVIDYKAGSSRISARRLEEGTRVQLPLYALAAQEMLEGEVASGFYWHVTAAAPSYLKLEKFEGGVTGAIETALAHTRRVVTAVRAGQFTPETPDGGCPPFCPAVAFCERFEPRRW